MTGYPVGLRAVPTARDVEQVLDELTDRVIAARSATIGFPAATDVDYGPLLNRFPWLLNNVGDPYVDIPTAHTKDLEREVVEFLADAFRAPPADRWGYVTSGGTEGNLYGLMLGRSLYPSGLVYHSEASHYSVPKAADLLGVQSVAIRSTDTGGIDYADLREMLARNRHRPAIVVANIGTTMTEAIDDVRLITSILRELAISQRHIHADAALTGLPLALIPTDRPGFDFRDGADSITISGHKFLGTPMPCGAVLTRRSVQQRIIRPVAYTGSPDTTVTGSRSGHAALMLWYAIHVLGRHGLHQRAEQAREVAAYVQTQLTAIGWDAWRHPYAFTVVLKTPPAQVLERWALATEDGYSHLVCMPGVSRGTVDAFVADLAASAGTGGYDHQVVPFTRPTLHD